MNLTVPETADVVVAAAQPALVPVTQLVHMFTPPIEPPGPEKFCRDEVWVSKVKEVFHLKDQHCFVFRERVEQIVVASTTPYLKV